MSDLHRLSIPFPPKMVDRKQGADYVNHGVVQQRLIGTIGPPDQKVVQFIRGDFDEVKTNAGKDNERVWPGREDAIVGVVLGCTYHVDGRAVYVEDVGTPEGYYIAPHDGERAKKAISDAVKRCAKQVGVALNLWSKGAYFLPDMLQRELVSVVDPEGNDGPRRVVDSETGEILTVESDAAEGVDHDAPDPDDVVTGEATDEPRPLSASTPTPPPADDGPPPTLDIPGDPPPTPQASPLATGAQIKKIHTLCTVHDIDDATYRALMFAKYGVESSKALTRVQAGEFIDALEDDAKRSAGLEWVAKRRQEAAV